jgi:hypothetical protein
MRRTAAPGRIRVLVTLLPLLLTGLCAAPAGAVVRPQQPTRPAAQEDPLRFARSLYTDGLYDLAAEQLRVQIERGLPPALEEEARWLLPQALEGAGRPAEAAAAFLDFSRRRGSSAHRGGCGPETSTPGWDAGRMRPRPSPVSSTSTPRATSAPGPPPDWWPPCSKRDGPRRR